MAMTTVEKSIDINVPVHTAYNQWTQFEEFPRFMEGVEAVRQLDDTHLHWRAKIAGNEKEWDSIINEQVPDERITWHSVSGAENAGEVQFHPVDGDKTRVTLRLGYDPEGFIENVGDKLGFVSRQVDNDLEHFKDYIEERGSATGSWRGEVHGGQEQSGGFGTGSTP
jgi:uncharacterized membrane protein